MIWDVSFSHAVEAETEEDAVRVAAFYFLNNPNAVALVGEHRAGDSFGQNLNTVIRISDGVKSRIPDPKTQVCRSCGALVEWKLTAKGKWCPFNPDGTSHFTTCPQASGWSKNKKHP